MTSRPGSGRSVPDSYYFDSDNFFNGLKRDNSFPKRQSRSAFRDRSEFEQPRPASSGRFKQRNFSPGPRVSGEDILTKLKDQLRKESDMFFYSQPEWDNDMHSRKADDSDDWAHKGFEEMRSRHPMFRMPNWMSEDDDDISNLASRMSQSPHFASMGRRGGPWRERRNSGGSAMSGTSEEDSVDGHNLDRGYGASGNAVRIPIRIEAEAPPGCMPQQSQQPSQQHQQQHHDEQLPQQQQQQSQHNPQAGMGQINKQPQFASKTTSSMNSVEQEVPRNTRCSSAPPDMTDPLHGHRFVSKATIVPQIVNDKPLSSSPDFNNVAKPFVPSHKAHDAPTPILEENSADSEVQEQNIQSENPQHHHHQQQPEQQPYQEDIPQQQYHQGFQHQQHPNQSYQEQPQHQWDSGHKSSVVRNIPIIFEGKKQSSPKERTSVPSRSPPQSQQYNKQPQFDHPFHDPHFGFSSQGFSTNDPFFNFSSPSQQYSSAHQQEQHPGQQPQHAEHQQPQKHSQPQPTYQQPQKSYPQQEFQPQSQPKDKSPQPDPIDRKMSAIESVRASVTELQEKVEKFDGSEKNKEFLFIDEMLTRALLQLDNIDPDGKDNVRQARRTLIKDINNSISKLEKKVTDAAASKANNPIPTETKTATDQTGENNTNMEVVEPNSNVDVPVENKTEVEGQITLNSEPEKIEVDSTSSKEPLEVKTSEESQPVS